MQHPFEGVMGVGQESAEAGATRRSVLGRMLGAVAALFGLGAVASAAPPRRPTTYALGEEGGVTTYALGEEGGATTYALGEEGGYGRARRRPPTTLMLGEEGGVTTQAIGEEGGVTTQALGEEGGRR
jgi:hypothetical protein